ncbi:polyketide synthase-like protein [Bombardia bombarda]|uniref:Polyketide synthase-like protein n=1 Tax=Bombardia bombarda TaxID=252184 RepID=A0AA40C9Q8_9PEZI|nr:polyketide synthase-like protein [Bombardia bombarda]
MLAQESREDVMRIGRKGLWDYLAQARSAWTKISNKRFDVEAFYKPGADKAGVFRAEGAHFVPDDIYAFDAAFFNMRAEEAKNSDPQHRTILECALEAAEDAGHSLIDLAGKRIGVFIGSGQHEYSQRLGDDSFSAKTFSATGVAPYMAANRVSYFFDIDGPSISLDAACASSVYAAHQAVCALRNDECDGAFVASSSLNLGPGGWLALEKTGALSEGGRSYSYDDKAAGFGRGEGSACLLIKRLPDAIRDGDPVQAIILSSACNHGGRSEGGITAPSGVAQRKLLRHVHACAGLDPAHTPVVEGHGTGTAVGDPIEAGAFTSVLAEHRTAENPIYIGSVKSNFGHLEGASGVLGMVKAVMMLKNGIVLPTAGFEKINHRIENKEKIVVLQTPIPWPANEPRRLMVTNFGFGGSNSAIIMEEAPRTYASNDSNGSNGHAISNNGYSNGSNGHSNGSNVHSNSSNGYSNGSNGHSNNNDTTPTDQSKRLFVFSAKAEKSLTAYLTSFDDYLDEDAPPETSDFLRDLSYTLGQRRSQHQYRVAVAADSLQTLQEKLLTAKPTRIKDRTLAFAFTGQGVQHAQMASELQHYETFATALKDAEAHLNSMGATWSLSEELAKPASSSRVDVAEISQPACTAVQLALVNLLKSWGVTPAAVTGHSSGEIAAAYSAGLLPFRTAIAVAYFRGQAAARLARQQSLSQTQKGAMLALGVSAEEAAKLIEHHAKGYVTVAAINSPKSVTVSGDEHAIENVQRAAEEQGLFVRRLKIEMAESVSSSDEARPVFVSSVTGKVADPATIDATYWVKNLVQPVRFAEAIQSMFTSPDKSKVVAPNVIAEIGPHSALKGPTNQTLDSVRHEGIKQAAAIVYVPSLIRGTAGSEALLDLAGSLFTLGSPINLGAVNQTNKTNSHVITGLPAYEWDKSVSYDVRPRATHEKFFPGEPYHHLLGRRVQSDSAKERVYRQVFSLDEAPWIRDHNVAGQVIFPMTGYMSMAIEAARRTTSTTAAAFLVTDFHVVRRLEIQEEETIEMITKIRPVSTGTVRFSSTVWSFDISTWSQANGWMMHTYRQVEPEFTEMTTDTPTLKVALPLCDTAPSLNEQDVAYAYEYAGVRSTRYGPIFKNTTRFWEGDGYTVMEHRVRNLGSPEMHEFTSSGSPITVDPPTLDGCLQGGGPLQIREDGRRPAMMPNYISRFRVSNSIPSNHKQRFDIVTRLLHHDSKSGRLTISVAAFARNEVDNSLSPVAEWESCAFRAINSAEDDPDPAFNVPDNWVWEQLPRIDFLTVEDLTKRFSIQDLGRLEEIRVGNMEQAALYFMDRALKITENDDRSGMAVHLAKFHNFATNTLAKYKNKYRFDSEPTALLENVRKADAQGELLYLVGHELVRILRSEIETLEIMLAEGRLTRYYEADVMNAHLSKVLGELVNNLFDLEPHLRILEIGGGTAGTTLPVLEAVSRGRRDEETSFLNYTFTDISSGFFENARTKLAKWSSNITYKKLDISQDPVEQGFTLGEFDLVIAANVLHATHDMFTTMTNVRSLLKPRGKLLLLEGNWHSPTVLPFSLLPGWWYSVDDYRNKEEGPLMRPAMWNKLLVDTGFTGVDIDIPDAPGTLPEKQNAGIICSTRIGKPDETKPVTIVGPFIDDADVRFAKSVADAVSSSLGCAVNIKPFTEVDPSENPYYIVIDSARHSLTKNVTAEKFQGLKKVLNHNKGVMWIIPQGGSPDTKIIKGLMRTLRIENDVKNLFLFDEVPVNSSEALSSIDFTWRNGSIHLPRLYQLKDVKETFAVESGISFRKMQNIWEGDRALEMTIDTAGSPESLYYQRNDDLQKPLADDEVIVEVEAAGVSHRDLNLVLGAMPWAAPGLDGAGKIVKTGRRVADLKPGDKVFFLSLDGSAFSTYKKMPSWHVAKVPTNISITDAASFPLAYSLAVMALNQTARLRKNETVLIHAAAGVVGQACLVLAQSIGAKIYATAGTDEKREYLHKEFGIPKEQIFSSRVPGFRDKILSATDNKGVDVVVNSLGGEMLVETVALVAKFGRFVEVGKKDALFNSNMGLRPLDNNVTFSGVDLRALYEHRPKQVKEVFQEVVGLLQRKVIGPIKPVTVLPISQFATALKKLKGGDNMGKIVVTLGKEEVVLAESALRETNVKLKTNATYLITGGTRGIGLDLAYWMINHGAKNVVVLGRSGSAGPDVQKLLKKYAGTDVTIRAIVCDVGSKESLAGVMKSIRDLPPVKGCIHSALLLSDKLFENAMYEDWNIIMRPRVQGAWNLDELLPKDLDFFIALSSFLGDIGNGGQAIYAGTASFYDAFSQYRNAKSQHTVSVALPVVLDVGYVADNNLADILKQSLGATLTMGDIRTIIKGAIMGPSSPFHHGGKTAAFKIYLDGQAVQNAPWKYFHPLYAAAGSWATAEDPLEGLTQALVTKVSTMTMIEREEVDPEVPLVAFNLDSLVSVELRNWIRRETGVELALSAITAAGSLRGLAGDVLAQRTAAA